MTIMGADGGMELTVVGCSGSLAGPRSPASSYLITAPYQGRQFRLVVDLGSGALGSLYGLTDPSAVDAIAISHLHPDHCIDLCAFHVASRHAPGGPWPTVPLYGPPGTDERIGRAYDASERGDQPEDVSASFGFRVWQPEQTVGPFTISTAVLAHPVTNYGLRIATEDAVLVYSGDTGPTPALIELAAGADLLLCEAAATEAADNQPDLHLTGRQAAEHAAAAGVGRLLLTHVPPWYRPDDALAEARGFFDGPIALAERELRVPINPITREVDHD